MNPLFDDGSDSDTNTRLTTNRDFAKTFNRLREKELFKRCKKIFPLNKNWIKNLLNFQ